MDYFASPQYQPPSADRLHWAPLNAPPPGPQLLEAGGVECLAADPSKLREAVVFGAATGALTCTRPGAIGAQPTLDEVEALVAESKEPA
jgi:hypothetical protein